MMTPEEIRQRQEDREYRLQQEEKVRLDKEEIELLSKPESQSEQIQSAVANGSFQQTNWQQPSIGQFG